MTYFFYLFEVHSVQSYILSSGKLKDMVGASELLESLLQEPLDEALNTLGYKEGLDAGGDYDVSRRGSSAFSLLFTDRDKALVLRDLWGLVISGMAPGLPFAQSISKDAETPNEAFIQASEQLRSLRISRAPELPVAGPLVRRSPRTGNPSVKLDDRHETPEWIDLATDHKRTFSEAPLLENKLDPDNASGCRFPSNTDTEFPVDVTRYVGILHADGNALGNITASLVEELASSSAADFTATFKLFSEKINSATREAAQLALQPIIDATLKKDGRTRPFLPFRPLVLGGDDLTVIVGAEFAYDFTQNFLEHFEAKTKEHLADMQQYASIPEQLTACAGLAFIKINQPFRMGYRLAESLCLEAKQQSKALVDGDSLTPSSLVFHRVTTSMIEDYSIALPRELTAWDGSDSYQLTLGAYGVGEHAGNLPALNHLQAMKTLFCSDAMSRGPMRHFTTLLHESIPEARKSYARWLENMRKAAQQEDLESGLNTYNELVEQLLGTDLHAELPFSHGSDPNAYHSFLGDLISWMAVEGESQ